MNAEPTNNPVEVHGTTLPVIGPDSAWFWTMIQAVAVSVTLILIYRQVRAQRQATMLDALFRFSSRWDGVRLVQARKEVCDKYSGKPNTDLSLVGGDAVVASFFEEIGSLVRSGAFSADPIWNSYSYYIEHYWPMLKDKVKKFQHEERDKTFFENFEWIYNRLQKIAKRRKVVVVERQTNDLRKFIKGELQHVHQRQKELLESTNLPPTTIQKKQPRKSSRSSPTVKNATISTAPQETTSKSVKVQTETNKPTAI